MLTHPAYLDHDSGFGHPERPARLRAVLEGIEASGAVEAIMRDAPRPATREELARVHDAGVLDQLERFCLAGGGPIDGDTTVGPDSWTAAVLAAGAGPTAIERLGQDPDLSAAFCVVRPPGHHATPTHAMGFCLVNNVAVTAAALAAKGERVLIVDWDAHHGNGTQDAFYRDGRVAFVSMHQWPLYPGSGSVEEVGDGAGRGLTVNLPFPSRTTGEAYLAAVDEVIAPLAARFRPTWLLISAGFDAHRADPLTSLGLTAGDFALLTERVVALAPPGRRIVFLEGGYDLAALASSAGATVAALAGHAHRPEAPSSGSGDGGLHVVATVKQAQNRLAS